MTSVIASATEHASCMRGGAVLLSSRRLAVCIAPRAPRAQTSILRDVSALARFSSLRFAAALELTGISGRGPRELFEPVIDIVIEQMPLLRRFAVDLDEFEEFWHVDSDDDLEDSYMTTLVARIGELSELECLSIACSEWIDCAMGRILPKLVRLREVDAPGVSLGAVRTCRSLKACGGRTVFSPRSPLRSLFQLDMVSLSPQAPPWDRDPALASPTYEPLFDGWRLRCLEWRDTRLAGDCIQTIAAIPTLQELSFTAECVEHADVWSALGALAATQLTVFRLVPVWRFCNYAEFGLGSLFPQLGRFRAVRRLTVPVATSAAAWTQLPGACVATLEHFAALMYFEAPGTVATPDELIGLIATHARCLRELSLPQHSLSRDHLSLVWALPLLASLRCFSLAPAVGDTATPIDFSACRLYDIDLASAGYDLLTQLSSISTLRRVEVRADLRLFLPPSQLRALASSWAALGIEFDRNRYS